VAGDARGGRVEPLARRLFALEKAAWGSQAFSLRYFERRLADPRAVVLALRAPDATLAGFLIAMPDDGVPHALYVEDTLVDEPYRGRGLVALLGRALEDEARKRGYRYLTRDASIENGYADAIERAYAGRVLARVDHPSEYGPQRYLKLVLGPTPAARRPASGRAARPPRP
jgi:GNAT superfamily N-acetyltransferase